MPYILAIIAFISAVMLLKNTKSTIETVNEEVTEISYPDGFDGFYQQFSEGRGYDWKLLKAIAIVESNENPSAVNSADPSYGICQLLCQPDSTGNRVCKNALNVVGWPPESMDKLMSPEYNIFIASQILEWNIANYGLPQGIAVYNNWSARNSDPNGPFPNQEYVDKVLSAYERIPNG